MAHRSDTSNRDVSNKRRETVLDGEIADYDVGLSFLYDGDVEQLESDFSGLEVDLSKDEESFRERAEVLYRLEDREVVYSLIS